jgi:DNA-binding response OmpR family regulator
MSSLTVVLSTSLDEVLRQTAASDGRSIESIVNTAVSEYLAWRDCPGSNSAIRIGNIELVPVRRLVRKNAVSVRLTPTEFDLLHYLMLHAGLPLTHTRLLRAVWGIEYGSELEHLRTYVRQLRKKLEDNPAEPKYLLTAPYYGYRFADVTEFGGVLSQAKNPKYGAPSGCSLKNVLRQKELRQSPFTPVLRRVWSYAKRKST